MDAPESFVSTRLATAQRPLLGLTILVVEDSRFTLEALRLICQRSGARLRRADSLAHARRHLTVYRPGCLIVDQGMPDGDGTDLIAEMAASQPRIGIILGMSGDPDARDAMIAAGADAFVAKPLTSIADFQNQILALLPVSEHPVPRSPAPLNPAVSKRDPQPEAIAPDPIAFRDDMHHAAGVLADADGPRLDYVTQFLRGVARSAGDSDLSTAVADLAAARRQGAKAHNPARARLDALISSRLEGRPGI